ncbi:MAG: efflux RND transporter permease subunit, partial [Acidimicrobiales bacterium]
LSTLATTIATSLGHNPQVSQVSTSIPISTPELAIQVNQAAAASLGVSTTTIGSTVAAALGNAAAPPLVTSPTAPTEPIQVSIGGSAPLSPAQLGAIPIPTSRGTVPLTAVASLSIAPGPSRITQVNREYSVSVSASSPSGNSGPALAALLGAARQVGMPTGYSLQVGGAAAQQKSSFGPLISALMLAVLLVYMLLAALYESFTDPLSVMLAVPLATVGALLALWAAGLPMSIFAILAMIMLIGIVSKNAILIVDRSKKLRGQGMDRTGAIINAGATRLRPILMTTATMVGAMLPFALSTGSGASERMPIGVVLIGGLLSSTLLTLLVVPVLYSAIDDATSWIARLARHLRPGHPAPSAEAITPGTT